MDLYDIKGNALKSAYSSEGGILSEAYRADGRLIPFVEFLPYASVAALPSITISGNKQGGCTDGEYIYQIMIEPAIGIKYKISDGTYTTKALGTSIPYNHGNDLAYNPNNKHIYVAAMNSDGSVIEVDNEWNYVATHYLVNSLGSGYSVWRLCFDRTTNHFLSQYSPGIEVYDENFNYLKHLNLPSHPSTTEQSMDTDGYYLFRLCYNPNFIDVSRLEDGKQIKIIEVPVSNEPEAIMYDWNGNFYMGVNETSGIFYKINFEE